MSPHQKTNDSIRNMEIATIIRQQLGGNKFKVMTGAKDFVAISNGLQFKLPSRQINLVQITLNTTDSYDIKFFKAVFSRNEVKTVKAVEGIYDDQLAEIFEETTGLRTSL